MSANRWLFIGALCGGLSVGTGAFAAHFLDGFFSVKYAGQQRQVGGETVSLASKFLHDFKTGAEYQMYHSLALLGVGLMAERRTSRAIHVAGWAFTAGMILFSGSLYVLTLTGVTRWGMITPIGGLAFLVGWMALLFASFQSEAKPSH